MRENALVYLVLVALSSLFYLVEIGEAVAFERQIANDHERTPLSTKMPGSVKHVEKSSQFKRDTGHTRQPVSEARELADLSILMEKALNANPSAGPTGFPGK